MNRVQVTSSNIASIRYDETAQTLEVEFNHGGIYQYYGVPSVVHSAMMAAASVGTFFAVNVKRVGYRYNRVG